MPFNIEVLLQKVKRIRSYTSCKTGFLNPINSFMIVAADPFSLGLTVIGCAAVALQICTEARKDSLRKIVVDADCLLPTLQTGFMFSLLEAFKII